MDNLLILIKKNFKLLFIKKRTIISFLYPVIFMLAIIKLSSLTGQGIKIGIVDKDSTLSSKILISSLQGGESKSFNMINLDSKSDINEKIIQKDVNLVITIPEGFEDKTLKGNGDGIEVSTIKGGDLQGFATGLINFHVKNLNDFGKASLGNELKYKEMINSYSSSADNVKTESIKDVGREFETTRYSIGILIFFLLIRAVTVSILVKQERQENTYTRLFMAPVSSTQYLGANVITNIIMLIIQILIVQVSLEYILKIQTGVGFISMFILLLLISIVAVSIGTFCISIFKDEQAISVFLNIVITGTCMISGCFVPVELLPENVQQISFFTPQRWVIDAIGKLQLGMKLSDVWLNLVVLIAFALTFFMIAVYKVRISQKQMN